MGKAGRLALLLVVAGACLAWLCHLAWAPIEPTAPTLVAGSQFRCVIDLLHAPPAPTAERSGPAHLSGSSTVPVAPEGQVELPAPSNRYLIAEIRDGVAVVGWGDGPDDHPEAVLAIATGAGVVNGWPDPREPGLAVIRAVRSYREDKVGCELRIRFAP